MTLPLPKNGKTRGIVAGPNNILAVSSEPPYISTFTFIAHNSTIEAKGQQSAPRVPIMDSAAVDYEANVAYFGIAGMQQTIDLHLRS